MRCFSLDTAPVTSDWHVKRTFLYVLQVPESFAFTLYDTLSIISQLADTSAVQFTRGDQRYKINLGFHREQIGLQLNRHQ